MMMSDEKRCVICDGTDEMGENGLGNNPYPVSDKGRCCDLCNALYVIPQRMEDLLNKRIAEKTPVE